MKKAKVFVDGVLAGHLIEWEKNQSYEFSYLEGYCLQSISLTMPLTRRTYRFDHFPPFFDGFLPEGFMLDAMLRKTKLDSNDHYSINGLKSLSPKLNHLNDFPYGKASQLELAIQYSDKLSFSGVQPKLNAKLNIDTANFEVVGRGGTFILKPVIAS